MPKLHFEKTRKFENIQKTFHQHSIFARECKIGFKLLLFYYKYITLSHILKWYPWTKKLKNSKCFTEGTYQKVKFFLISPNTKIWYFGPNYLIFIDTIPKIPLLYLPIQCLSNGISVIMLCNLYEFFQIMLTIIHVSL